jgi:hypothetical protein
MEHLIRLFFTNQGRSKLDKIDFYKIFSSLLPANTSEQKYNTYNNIKIDPNMTTKTNDNNINNDSPSNVKQSQLTNNKNYFTANQLKDINQKFEEDKKDRNLTELGALVVKYKFSKGKPKLEAVDLFKNIFDKDASLGIDKKELGIGFGKMGIELNENEKNNLWKKMGGSKGNIDFASFKAFHDNYCLMPNQSNQNTIVSNQNKTVSSGGFESETQIK